MDELFADLLDEETCASVRRQLVPKIERKRSEKSELESQIEQLRERIRADDQVIRAAEKAVARIDHMYPHLAQADGRVESAADPEGSGAGDNRQRSPDETDTQPAELRATGSSVRRSEDGADHDAAFKPRGRAAVLRVMADESERWLTVKQVTTEMQARGWAPESNDPVSAVRSALFRLHKDKQVEQRDVDGRTVAYRLTNVASY